MAESLHVSRQAVSRWELGSAMPDAENVRQLGKLFGVTADYLLNDECETASQTPDAQTASDGTAAEERRTFSRKKRLHLIAAVCFTVALIGSLATLISDCGQAARSLSWISTVLLLFCAAAQYILFFKSE